MEWILPVSTHFFHLFRYWCRTPKARSATWTQRCLKNVMELDLPVRVSLLSWKNRQVQLRQYFYFWEICWDACFFSLLFIFFLLWLLSWCYLSEALGWSMMLLTVLWPLCVCFCMSIFATCSSVVVVNLTYLCCWDVCIHNFVQTDGFP